MTSDTAPDPKVGTPTTNESVPKSVPTSVAVTEPAAVAPAPVIDMPLIHIVWPVGAGPTDALDADAAPVAVLKTLTAEVVVCGTTHPRLWSGYHPNAPTVTVCRLRRTRRRECRGCRRDGRPRE